MAWRLSFFSPWPSPVEAAAGDGAGTRSAQVAAAGHRDNQASLRNVDGMSGRLAVCPCRVSMSLSLCLCLCLCPSHLAACVLS